MSEWPARVDAVTNDPARIKQRKNIEPGMTVPRSMSGEVQCGFLTYHPPMPHFPTIVRYKGQWMPEALITHGDHKRFTDAELAAEFHRADTECQIAWIDGEHTDAMQARFDTVERFAMAPHFDE